jgi:hypothetical protein
MICTENVRVLHPFLAKGVPSKTFEMWYWGLSDMEISIGGPHQQTSERPAPPVSVEEKGKATGDK